MTGKIESISFDDLEIDNTGDFYNGSVRYFTCYAEDEWAEITVLVRVPKEDHRISELKEVILKRAKDALVQLHQADYTVTDGQQ